MTTSERSATLLSAILSGDRPELARLAAMGELPLLPEELLTLQVHLAESEEPSIAQAAAQALADVDPSPVRAVLAADPDPETLGGLLRHLRSPDLLADVARHPRLRAEDALRSAATFPAEVLEVLVLREDLLRESPKIFDALEANEELGPHLRRRLGEYREHMLAPERQRDEDRNRIREATDEELEAALELALLEPAGGEQDEERTGLSEQQIRGLSVGVRLRLSRGCSGTLLDILLRDPNPNVALAAFERNPVGGSVVERLVHSRTAVPDVLEAIATHRRWQSKYLIVYALAKNPRTPVGTAVRLIPRLAPRDLRALSKDRNIPDAVRTRAATLYRMRIR